MSASVHYLAVKPHQHTAPDAEWPGCEQTKLPGDGSMTWLGLLLLGGTSLVTLRGLVWVGQMVLAHL